MCVCIHIWRSWRVNVQHNAPFDQIQTRKWWCDTSSLFFRAAQLLNPTSCQPVTSHIARGHYTDDQTHTHTKSNFRPAQIHRTWSRKAMPKKEKLWFDWWGFFCVERTDYCRPIWSTRTHSRHALYSLYGGKGLKFHARCVCRCFSVYLCCLVCWGNCTWNRIIIGR